MGFVTKEEIRDYHIKRTLDQVMKCDKVFSVWMLHSIHAFDRSKLKHVTFSPRKPPIAYFVLPIEQRIEDLQLKVHNLRNVVNVRAALIDVKKDISTLLQEYRVHEQNNNKSLDAAFLEGFNEGCLQTRDGFKNFIM